MTDTRIEIETDRRGLSSDEIQELSKREMQGTTGGGEPQNGWFRISSSIGRLGIMGSYADAGLRI